MSYNYLTSLNIYLDGIILNKYDKLIFINSTNKFASLKFYNLIE
jgi:hypothetical protein